MGYLEKFTSDVDEAAAAGVLTADTADSLKRRVAEREGKRGISAIFWIAAFAGLSVTAGLSLIIAHNWDSISPEAKVGGFVAMLAAVGTAAIRLRDRSPAVAVPAELLWLFAPLLGIGLYAQVFHLSGDPVRPFLVWLLLGLPAVWGSPRPAAPSIHAISAAIVLLFGTVSRGNMLSLAGRDSLADVPASAWPLMLMLAASCWAVARRTCPPTVRSLCLGLLSAWPFFAAASRSPFHLDSASALTAVALSAAVLWLSGVPSIASGGRAMSLARGAWIWTLYAATFFRHSWAHRQQWAPPDAGPGLALAFCLLALAGLSAALAPAGVLGPEPRWDRPARGGLAAALAVAALLLSGNAAAVWAASWLANLLILAGGTALMWRGAAGEGPEAMNLGIAALFLLLVTRFIDVLGTFLEGGFAFVGAGAALGLVAYALHRSRKFMVETAGERR